jgi:hypothetical protein
MIGNLIRAGTNVAGFVVGLGLGHPTLEALAVVAVISVGMVFSEFADAKAKS